MKLQPKGLSVKAAAQAGAVGQDVTAIRLDENHVAEEGGVGTVQGNHTPPVRCHPEGGTSLVRQDNDGEDHAFPQDDMPVRSRIVTGNSGHIPGDGTDAVAHEVCRRLQRGAFQCLGDRVAHFRDPGAIPNDRHRTDEGLVGGYQKSGAGRAEAADRE